MRSNVGWRRCWEHLSPPQDWMSRCLETVGGWQTSKVRHLIHTCLKKDYTCFSSPVFFPSLSNMSYWTHICLPLRCFLTETEVVTLLIHFQKSFSHWCTRIKVFEFEFSLLFMTLYSVVGSHIFAAQCCLSVRKQTSVWDFTCHSSFNNVWVLR